jgi:hypothetical protein
MPATRPPARQLHARHNTGPGSAQGSQGALSCPRTLGQRVCPGREARQAGRDCPACGAEAYSGSEARRLRPIRQRDQGDAFVIEPRSARTVRVLASIVTGGSRVITVSEGQSLARELRAFLQDLEHHLGCAELVPTAPRRPGS